MGNKLIHPNSNNQISSNPLHSDTSTPLVSSMNSPHDDTMANLIINDNIKESLK